MQSDFINVIENNTTTFNKDIIVKDLDDNSRVVVKCYCTITKSKSMSYYIDIIDSEIYNKNKEAFQVEIDKYIEESKRIAVGLEVPYIL